MLVGCAVGVFASLLEIVILCVWIYLCRERKIDFLKAFGVSFLFVSRKFLVFALVNAIPCFDLYTLYMWNHVAGIIAIAVYIISWAIAFVVCREQVKDMLKREERERVIKALSLENSDTGTC